LSWIWPVALSIRRWRQLLSLSGMNRIGPEPRSSWPLAAHQPTSRPPACPCPRCPNCRTNRRQAPGKRQPSAGASAQRTSGSASTSSSGAPASSHARTCHCNLHGFHEG
jgi:hypothetical protein